MNTPFDEERFAALLDMAGQDIAAELTQRLDEDLTRVGLALGDVRVQADAEALHAQSHILLSIAGTIGATLVFDLAKRLNSMVRGADLAGLGAVLAEILREIGAALNHVILRVRAKRSALTGPS